MNRQGKMYRDKTHRYKKEPWVFRGKGKNPTCRRGGVLSFQGSAKGKSRKGKECQDSATGAGRPGTRKPLPLKPAGRKRQLKGGDGLELLGRGGGKKEWGR